MGYESSIAKLVGARRFNVKPLNPIEVRYQAALRPDNFRVRGFWPRDCIVDDFWAVP